LDECKSIRKGGQELKIYPHRPGRRYVESFSLASSPDSFEAAATAALRVLEYMIKPLHPVEAPYHPSGEPTAEAAKPVGDVEKWTVKQLREFIATNGAKCVGCADKADFVREAKKFIKPEL
jgi:hypothetical protein